MLALALLKKEFELSKLQASIAKVGSSENIIVLIILVLSIMLVTLFFVRHSCLLLRGFVSCNAIIEGTALNIIVIGVSFSASGS